MVTGPSTEKDARPRTPPWEDWNRRFRFGRLAIYPEPRDVWIGVYVAPDAVYVCPLPMLVFRWTRRPTSPEVCVLSHDGHPCGVCVTPPGGGRGADPS